MPNSSSKPLTLLDSSELSNDSARGTALAQEFQANILGLNLAFAINLAVTNTLGKYSQWAWRTPILVMQVFSLVMLAVVNTLPETPRWYVFHDQPEKAEKAIAKVWGKDAVDERIKPLKDAHQKEQEDSDGGGNSYADMLLPSRPQFHPTVITIMGQVNQALTGYGAVSVYGPQIFELLGFNVRIAEYLTMGNYVFYLAMMTFAWLLIDRKGTSYPPTPPPLSPSLQTLTKTPLSRPSLPPPPRLPPPRPLLHSPHHPRLPRLPLPIPLPTHPHPRPRNPRHSRPLPRHRCLRHLLARPSLPHPNRDLPHNAPRPGLRGQRRDVGLGELRGHVVDADWV